MTLIAYRLYAARPSGAAAYAKQNGQVLHAEWVHTSFEHDESQLATAPAPAARPSKLAIATDDAEERAWRLVFTSSRDARWVQLAGGIITSLWSSSPSRPPTAKPAPPKCFTYTFKYRRPLPVRP